MMKHDINNRMDVEKLVNVFYRKILVDDFLSPNYIRINWRTHLSTIYTFWYSILFESQSYPIKRVSVNLTHFQLDRWLTLFNETVNENFTGKKAEEAKDKALYIMTISQVGQSTNR